jgi:hypothetical protein
LSLISARRKQLVSPSIRSKKVETIAVISGSIVSRFEGVCHMQSTHLSALEAKHAVIERRLADETRRPLPDPTLLSLLKKQKLRLKEALSGRKPK